MEVYGRMIVLTTLVLIILILRVDSFSHNEKQSYTGKASTLTPCVDDDLTLTSMNEIADISQSRSHISFESITSLFQSIFDDICRHLSAINSACDDLNRLWCGVSILQSESTCNTDINLENSTLSDDGKRIFDFQNLIDSTLSWVADGIQKEFRSSTGQVFDIAETVEICLDLMSPSKSMWVFLGEEENLGIKVWKAKAEIYMKTKPESKRWPCVKAHTIINARAESVAQLLMDSSKAHLLNRYCDGRTDIEMIGNDTKIVWNRTKLPYAFKPYDFCSLMHAHRTTRGRAIMLISQGVEHDDVKLHKDFSRSEIYFGVNVLVPLPHDPEKTLFTTISQVRYAGVPPMLAHRSLYNGIVGYLKQLKEKCSH